MRRRIQMQILSSLLLLLFSSCFMIQNRKSSSIAKQLQNNFNIRSVYNTLHDVVINVEMRSLSAHILLMAHQLYSQVIHFLPVKILLLVSHPDLDQADASGSGSVSET